MTPLPHNQLGKFRYGIRKAGKDLDTSRNQPLTLARDAWLGDKYGVITSFQGSPLPNGYVVVRDYDGNLSVAFNQRGIPLIPGIGVKVGYDPLQPTLFQVLSSSTYLIEAPAVGVAPHHSSHEFPGTDTVFVNSYQIVPGLLWITGTFTATIYPMYFRKLDGSVGYVPQQSIDFAPYVPASGARAVTVAYNDDGVVSIFSGAVVGGVGLITTSSFPQESSSYHRMWGVVLFLGQENLDYTNTYDFRGGSGSAAWGQIGGDINDQADLIAYFAIPADGMYRFTADGVATAFDLVDILATLWYVFDNSLLVDPLEVGLSSDGTQLVFNAAPTAGHVIVANGVLRSM